MNLKVENTSQYGGSKETTYGSLSHVQGIVYSFKQYRELLRLPRPQINNCIKQII